MRLPDVWHDAREVMAMKRCDDCGRAMDSEILEGVCARRSGHEVRCTCRLVRYGTGLVFYLPPGAVPGMIAGLDVNPSCGIHGRG